MEYHIINGKFSVNHIDLFGIGSSSNFMVGDIKHVSLFFAIEEPPEDKIIGVTIPVVPLQEPTADEGGDGH
ncbi:spore gernimation protein GerPD [Paenibacillus sp. SI8]|uniref:spore gernimation protein GerPD n=1 Tax=unclassified Paenibacillus TaxID=185978 RepID=UPI0034653924